MIYKNLTFAQLIEQAIIREEGQLSSTGAMVFKTGKRTGRSPKDRFIVNDNLTASTVDWGIINQPFPANKFARLWDLVDAHIHKHDQFVSHFHVGASKDYYIPVEVKTQTAWHTLFAQIMFIEPDVYNPKNKIAWQILHAPAFECQPDRDGTNSEGCVIINFTECKILLAGMHYAGEIKKSMFAVQNFVLPDESILPMHCSSNVGENGDVALFFGLSGTGKTTLSADSERYLIGDDEHAWTEGSVFNLEGGCYAKCIDLCHKNEPIIWNAIRFGTVLENVVIDSETRIANYTDISLTANTRAAYPLSHVNKRALANSAGEPKHIIFLTCDLNGVIPPVSCLSKEAAAYHFLSGYTALVGSTEVGAGNEITSTFSTCFGSPFFPRPANVYANLLMERIKSFDSKVFMVNTGWTGGPHGIGKRFDIPTTRAILKSILKNELDNCSTDYIDVLNLYVPKKINGVETKLLIPQKTWADQETYKKRVKQVARSFVKNFKKYDVANSIKQAGPNV